MAGTVRRTPHRNGRRTTHIQRYKRRAIRRAERKLFHLYDSAIMVVTSVIVGIVLLLVVLYIY